MLFFFTNLFYFHRLGTKIIRVFSSEDERDERVWIDEIVFIFFHYPDVKIIRSRASSLRDKRVRHV